MNPPENLNWTFWLILFVGNGAIIALLTMLQQHFFQKQNLKLDQEKHKQNLELEKEKHKQNLELEEKKRSDYLICHYYDELFEAAKILNQIMSTWWQIAWESEEQNKKAEISLWGYKCALHEKFKTEQIDFGSFLKQYDYIIPKEICNKLAEAEFEYMKNNFKKALELIVDARFMINNLLGIKMSQEEIKKRFEFIKK